MDFITKLQKNHPAIFLILVILALLFVLVFLDFVFFFPQSDRSTRIGELQLLVEILGLGALIIALLEFIEQAKKPNLKLWIGFKNESGDVVLTDGEINSYQGFQNFVIEKGTLNQEIVKAIRASFNLNLYLENCGEKVGRFVKVTLNLVGKHLDVEAKGFQTELRRIGENEWGTWSLEGGYSGETGRFHRFSGGENFVSYSHPKGIEDLEEWLEELGAFALRTPIWLAEVENFDLTLICTIQADEFDLATQEFRLLLPPIDIE